MARFISRITTEKNTEIHRLGHKNIRADIEDMYTNVRIRARKLDRDTSQFEFLVNDQVVIAFHYNVDDNEKVITTFDTEGFYE